MSITDKVPVGGIWSILLMAWLHPLPMQAALQAVNLRCAQRVNPLGVGDTTPRLSWELESDGQGTACRGETQSAYEIQVGSTRGAADLWVSGKVSSSQTVDVLYAGQPLGSGQRCFWRVRVYDGSNNGSVWGRPARWSRGLLGWTNWIAQWVGYDAAYTPTPQQAADNALFNTAGLNWLRFPVAQAQAGVYQCYLRKQVVLAAGQTITNAVVALYADNVCGVMVNGPAATNSAARWEATARINVTPWLHAGTNVLALAATNGDAQPASVIGRLVVQFASGSVSNIPVDTSWKAAQQPPANWMQTNFDDSAWTPAESTGTPWGTPALNDIARVPAPYLRKNFAVGQPVARATVYVTALGAYELHLNGRKVGHDVLTPGWSQFSRRVYYQTYDVTKMIRSGPNTIGAILGDGWYASVLASKGQRNNYGGTPRFLAQLVLEFADGSQQTVATDASWKASYGPIRHGDLLIGSEYDARLEMPGWDTTNFNDSAWSAVATGMGASGNGGLQVQAAVTEPARCLEELAAVSLAVPKPGCYTFDLGQNMVGWVRLKVSGSAGDRITVRHGEMLNPDGTVYTANLRGATATDFYILATNGPAVFEPRFTFHGFRYVEVRGLSAPPTLSSVTGIVVHSDMALTGAFACSSPLVNQLYHNIVWGQKGNYLEVPTDSPQRDERLGWTGDTELFVPTAAYNFDVQSFFRRHLVTLCEDCQHSDGSYPDFAPDLGYGGGAAGWGDAGWICPYTMYRAYGNTNVIADHYASFQRYGQYLNSHASNFTVASQPADFGDWLNLGGGGSSLVTDTAFYAYYAQAMSEMAAAIGKSGDAATYASLHAHIARAFANFFNSDGSFRDGSGQTGYALAFTLNLVPPALRTQAAQKFADTIAQFGNHLATGFIGTPRLLPALHAAGRDDLACQLLLEETYPSWLYQVKLGATTMWERWDGWTPFGGFQTVIMNSFNHYAFGSVGEYLYSVIGGIKPASPGYAAIVIKPVPGAGLTWANTSYHCIRGVISTAWTNLNNTFNLEVVIPPNTRAQVYVPTTDAGAITESGVLAVNSPGVTYLGLSNGYAVYSVGSGRYLWASPLPTPAAPLTVSAISWVGGNLVLNISGLASGQRYVLQSTTNLSTGVWLIEADFVAVQTAAAFTNSTADSDKKFYRIEGY